MEEQSLPTVPFGKYKGQPITNLLNDTKYLEWCKQQEWFKKFPIVYNICVNQTITTTNQNSKTPEHNKLQNLFLKNENVENLLKKVFKKYKNIKIDKGKVIFEWKFNWDLVVKEYRWCLCDCTKECCDCEVYEQFVEKYIHSEWYASIKFHELYCEIKPLLGDDYPSVLRKMTSQIELTNNYARKENEPFNELSEQNRYIIFTKEERFDNSQCSIHPTYVLLVKDFRSSVTTKEQLITIFKQSNIRVVFFDEFIDDLKVKTYIEQDEETSIDTYINKEIIQTTQEDTTCNLFEMQKKMLEMEERLVFLEDKNKQLEEEIKILKNNKSKKDDTKSLKNNKSKNITDYFGKNNIKEEL